MNAQQHMMAEQQHAASAEGGSAVPHVMPPQQSGFQAQGQGSQAVLSASAPMPPPQSAGMAGMVSNAGMYMGGGMSGGVSAPLMGGGGQPMYSNPNISMAGGAMLNSMAGMPPQTHSMQSQPQYHQQQQAQAQQWHSSSGMPVMQGGHQMSHGMSGGMQMQQQHSGVLQQSAPPLSHQ